MNHLVAHRARTFQIHGVDFHSFAASHTGSRSLAAWRADFAPRTPGQPHSMSEEEVLYVLEGRLDVEVDDDAFTACAGDAVLVPAGATFRVSNNEDSTARAWVTTVPGMRATMAEGGEVLSPPWAQ